MSEQDDVLTDKQRDYLKRQQECILRDNQVLQHQIDQQNVDKKRLEDDIKDSHIRHQHDLEDELRQQSELQESLDECILYRESLNERLNVQLDVVCNAHAQRYTFTEEGRKNRVEVNKHATVVEKEKKKELVIKHKIEEQEKLDERRALYELQRREQHDKLEQLRVKQHDLMLEKKQKEKERYDATHKRKAEQDEQRQKQVKEQYEYKQSRRDSIVLNGTTGSNSSNITSENLSNTQTESRSNSSTSNICTKCGSTSTHTINNRNGQTTSEDHHTTPKSTEEQNTASPVDLTIPSASRSRNRNNHNRWESLHNEKVQRAFSLTSPLILPHAGNKASDVNTTCQKMRTQELSHRLQVYSQTKLFEKDERLQQRKEEQNQQATQRLEQKRSIQIQRERSVRENRQRQEENKYTSSLQALEKRQTIALDRRDAQLVRQTTRAKDKLQQQHLTVVRNREFKACEQNLKTTYYEDKSNLQNSLVAEKTAVQRLELSLLSTLKNQEVQHKQAKHKNHKLGLQLNKEKQLCRELRKKLDRQEKRVPAKQ